MRLIGCVNVYEDGALLARTLPALRRVVDYLVVVDGAYEGFPNYGSVRSRDETLDVATKFADAIILLSHPQTEIQKRNAYLIGKRDDYYFVVDADEVVEVLREDGTVNPDGRIDVATMVERDDWLVTLKRAGDSTAPYPIHRLFRHRDGICYHGAHHAVHVGDRLINPNALEVEAPDSVFPRLRLTHLWNERDQNRAERKGIYYRDVLVPSERAWRAAHGLGR